MTDPQVLRNGTWTTITPEIAGWSYISFGVTKVDTGEISRVPADDSEHVLVNLSGHVTVQVGGDRFDLGGRASVFDGVGSCLYLPRQTGATIVGVSRAEIAIAAAPSSEDHEVVFLPASSIETVARGAGNASRQVATPLPPSFPADRLHIVEVWTPGGNWSSFPPHKHEHDENGEAQLEETYYYRLRDRENGWALQRVYSAERDFELATAVHDGDICLIPWGYHTTVAAHGHDLYYLNVLAGPAPARTLLAREDLHLTSVRETWDHLDVDARLPIVPGRFTNPSSAKQPGQVQGKGATR